MANDHFLTKQDIKFVKEYVKTGNGTKSVQAAYPTLNTYGSAAVKANDLLKKGKIQDAIQDEMLYANHIELFKTKKVDYFVFPKAMDDEAIVQHVNSVGIKVITVRETDKGKMAFYAVPDAQAIRGALDMAYKIKGTYAPEKSVRVNISAEVDPVVNELTEILNATVYNGTSIAGDGQVANAVGTQARD